jgi:hypothetical protein
MSAPIDEVTLTVTHEELRMLKNAMHAYISPWGHDEADVLHAAQHLLAKIEAEAVALAAP